MRKNFMILLILIFGLVLVSCENIEDKPIKLEDIQITITEFASGDSVNSVTEDFVLPIGFDNNVTATWESSNTDVIKISGRNAEVVRPLDSNKEVELTPTLKYTDKDGELIQLKRDAITVTVLKAEEEEIDLSTIELVIVFASGDDADNVTEDFVLPIVFDDDITATWVSDDTDVIVIDGSDAKVTRSLEDDVEVNLTATLKLGDETLERSPIKVTVLRLDLTPVVEGTLYHWMPDSVGANLVANIEIYDADPLDLEVKLHDYDLVEGLDFEVVGEELIIYGDFLVEKTNQLGDYELEVSTIYGSTTFEFFVVDIPENTSIETREIEVSDMASLQQAVLTEPIQGAPELMITEVSADAGKYSYIEVFNNSLTARNLKNHILVFADINNAINQASILEYDGLFAIPMGSPVFFTISVDFVLEPFETGIIWYINGGNRATWSEVLADTGVANYEKIVESSTSNTWLFEWQGGTLRENDFRRHHGINENVKVVTVRDNAYITNQTTAHDQHGFGTVIWRGGGFTSQNSSIANRGVQIIYLDPEIKHSVADDANAPVESSYFKMDVGVLNSEFDVYVDGELDQTKIVKYGASPRASINTLYIRKVYYDSDDEFVSYDNKWNFGSVGAGDALNNAGYKEIAKASILSTALFYPGLDDDGEYRWGTGHGMEYTVPVEGSHVMRFIPRSDQDYEAFVAQKYTSQVSKALYLMGLSEVIDEITNSKRTVVVPVSDAYVYDIPTKENSAGVTSKYNLGLD